MPLSDFWRCFFHTTFNTPRGCLYYSSMPLKMYYILARKETALLHIICRLTLSNGDFGIPLLTDTWRGSYIFSQRLNTAISTEWVGDMLQMSTGSVLEAECLPAVCFSADISSVVFELFTNPFGILQAYWQHGYSFFMIDVVTDIVAVLPGLYFPEKWILSEENMQHLFSCFTYFTGKETETKKSWSQ